MSFMVKSKSKDSVKCEVVDGGELKSRRHLNVRGKSATLPSITGSTVRSPYNFSVSCCFGRTVAYLSLDDLTLMLICYNYFLLAEKDWEDIKFGVENKVDFYAVSFVKDAQVVHELKKYLQSNYVKLILS